MKRRKIKLKLPIVLFLILSICFAFVCDKYIKPLTVATAKDSACAQVNTAVNSSVAQIMQDDYGSITEVIYDNDNNVKAVNTDAVKLNLLKSTLETALSKQTHEIKGGEVLISVGTLTGNEYLLGRGPKLKFKYDIENFTVGSYTDKFESVGINQTKYSVILNITTDIILLIPYSVEKAQVNCEIVIAQTVIVGQIPDSYTNVNISK